MSRLAEFEVKVQFSSCRNEEEARLLIHVTILKQGTPVDLLIHSGEDPVNVLNIGNAALFSVATHLQTDLDRPL